MKMFVSLLIACTIIEALQTLRPGAEWNVRGTSLEWLDKTQTAPTQAEIASAIVSCRAAASTRATQKTQARLDAKNVALPIAQRLQALLILQDLDQ